jgi:ubiquinol-cytochrome c reductase iron-sulfur subunit
MTATQQGQYMATVKKTSGTVKAGAKPAAAKKAPARSKTAPVAATAAEVLDNGQSETEGVRRRDFINIAAISFAGVGAIPIIGTLAGQMSASADVLAMASIEVDISSIETGQAIKTSWRKQPVFIRNLNKDEIDAAKKVDIKSLRDPQSLADRTKPGKENWLITMGVCTHLGCVPLGAAAGEVRGEFGGYFCPCHGSHYDTAARVRKGPAPLNLNVPEYSFLTDTTVKIG